MRNSSACDQLLLPEYYDSETKIKSRKVIYNICSYLKHFNLFLHLSRFLFLTIFYIFVLAWIFLLLFFLYLFSNIPYKHSVPSTQEILIRNPGLAIAVNSPYLPSYDCHNPNTYRHYIENIEELLMPYNSINGEHCYGGGSNNGNCTFDPLLLAECSKKDYGFSSGTPCFYVKLTKIINYIPDHKRYNKHYIPLSCHYYKPKKNSSDIKIHPSGILADALPYTFKHKQSYLSPLVAIKIPANMDVIVRCLLVADDIPQEGSYDIEYAVGKIEFQVEKMNNTYPCPTT